ncbi:thermonuclease family protein [Actinomycetospora endophytica]|uniref:Thermonuclease family protein n=1 Tax=Actinomycetospora endophytica TaxID=2291215 RepID=A0ABS8PD53_9PSEU|nr:thermonuclease family protein [Actinomycetospora endophytica]MCD2195913.1 thermonuclease family protein [Actinomycetospora endophytica]
MTGEDGGMGNHGAGRATGPATAPRPAVGTQHIATHHGGPPTGAHHAVRPRRRRPRLTVLLAVLAGVVLLVLGVLAGRMTAPGPTEVPAAAPAASASPVSDAPVSATPAATHPTSLGEVVRVDSGDEIVVRVDGQEQTVSVLGITAPRLAGPQRITAECGAKAALTFADDRLSGQTVTLVPDPTVPETDDQGRRLAYVVLASQLNYTDAALQAGVVQADTTRKLWYAPVFAREQSEAAAADRGLWGPPCGATPGQPLPAGS